VVFHVQLALRNCCVHQLDVQERNRIEPPDLCQGLHMLEVQNNLMWMPTVTNVASLLTLRTTVRVSASSGATTVTRSNLGENAAAVPATTSGTMRRDAGPSDHNPSRDPRYFSNTHFFHLVKSRTMSQAMAGCDPPPPGVVRSGVSVSNCVLWHVRGECFEFCKRCTDHIPQEGEE
jgi:hypothetical protein